MRELKKQIYLVKDNFLFTICTEIILFAVGQIMFAIAAILVEDNGEVFELGTFLALMAAFFVQFFSGFSILARNFNITVIMGGTRHAFVWLYALLTYVQYVVTMLLIYVFHLLELWKFRVFYPGKVLKSELSMMFQWKFILTACLAMLAFQMLIGALYLKIGKIVFWMIWAAWMVICIGGSQLADRLFHIVGQTGIDFLEQISVDWLVGGGILIAVIFLAAAGAMLLRQQAEFM